MQPEFSYSNRNSSWDNGNILTADWASFKLKIQLSQAEGKNYPEWTRNYWSVLVVSSNTKPY